MHVDIVSMDRLFFIIIKSGRMGDTPNTIRQIKCQWRTKTNLEDYCIGSNPKQFYPVTATQSGINPNTLTK